MPRILPFIPPRKRRAFGLGAIDQNALASGYGHEWLFLRPDVFNQVLAHGFPGDVYGGSDGVLIPESDLQIALANAVRRVMSTDNASNWQPVHIVDNGSENGPQITPMTIQEVNASLNSNFDPRWYAIGQVGEGTYSLVLTPAGRDAWNRLASTGIQVTQNPFNGSWLSIGAQGGYKDPRLINWSDEFGLVTPSSNYLQQQDTFWEQYGPLIAFAGTVLAIAGPELLASAGVNTTSAAPTVETASTVAQTIAPATEIQTAGEEALREIELAHIGGATITQGEAAGWMSALSNAGLSVPADIANIASGISQVSTQSANAPPEPSATPSTSTSTASTVAKQAGSQILTQAEKAAAGLLVSTATGSTPKSNSNSNVRYVTTGTGESPGFDVGSQSSQTSNTIAVTKPFPWIWLAIAAGAILVLNRKGHHE